MKDKLEIGHLIGGKKFTLPLDLVTRTLAIIAIRGWGKTVAATVIAEEMCEAGLPWVAIDPVGVWWGLRANPDGSPGGYPVVILGGEKADLPLEKSAGAKVADAVLGENVSCVIDMSSESKTTVRHFVADFCDRLMDLRPETPRHIFIEEAPELVPQRPMGEQKRSLAAVDRLIRLGRNRGYGATLISQRTATIQKDVLTQCESLLAGRSIGKPDREAMQDWIAEVVGVPSPKDADEFVKSLSGLQSGVGWFWSPQWLNVFEQIRIRRRKTYHPGETRTVGQTVKQVQLSDVREFVERFGKILSTHPESRTRSAVVPTFEKARAADQSALLAAQDEAMRLRGQMAELHQRCARAEGMVAQVRQHLAPLVEAIYGKTPATETSNGTPVSSFPSAVNHPHLEQWKAKLGKGVAKIIEICETHGALSRSQLSLLSGGLAKSTVNEYVKTAKRAGVLEESSEGQISLKRFA